MNGPLFPVAEYWWMYLGFTGLVLVLLTVDLLLHRNDRPISFRSAASWTVVWVSLAFAFSYALHAFTSSHYGAAAGRQVSLEFLAGYVVEESLSIDNMFVFALIFRYFAVPMRYQHKVLFYGVLGAMVFRGIFIAAGAALVRFEAVMIVFGLFLVFTGVRMAMSKDEQVNPGDSLIIRWVRRFAPITNEYHGSKFQVKIDGVRHYTPLMVVLLFLETTDLLFAVDSVPAVFGVSREPFVVYSSNVFAILGLRSLFFLLAGAMDRFHALKHGLALVLIFVGLKMVWLDHAFGGRFPIGASLAIISVLIGGSIVYSLVFPKGGESRIGGLFRGAAGVVFLVLAVWGFLYAAGPGHSILPLPALEVVGDVALYLSAGCSLIFGVLLLLRQPRAPRPSP